MNKANVIVVAAGEGQRFGFTKQTAVLKGKTVLEWCLEAFEQSRSISRVILVLRRDMRGDFFKTQFSKISDVVVGGEKRQDSVTAGFQKIEPGGAEIVLVHDGVRPLVGEDLIIRVIEAAKKFGAAVPAIPIRDTIKRSDGRWILRTEDRSMLYRTQTPQGFQFEILEKALRTAREQSLDGTDEASLVENMGIQVSLVPGDPENIKITTPLDLKIIEALLEN
ncbi:MAG: 2-C-methyl-D-erythritol 4-phosphate cytidylyltransferase [Candidatus Aminicenantes bacterium]|nr:2-C-methyl-D-erythritol 4-phosphate cytidylyltransferase [Candidatus Aminicenantes bacterium]